MIPKLIKLYMLYKYCHCSTIISWVYQEAMNNPLLFPPNANMHVIRRANIKWKKYILLFDPIIFKWNYTLHSGRCL